MSTRSIIATSLFAVLVCGGTYGVNFNLGVAVRVFDDSGNPVQGANVGVGFVKSRMNEKDSQIRGQSDRNGFFQASALSSGTIGVRATKDGYYESWIRGNFFKNSYEDFIRPYDPSDSVACKTSRIGYS